MERGEEREDDLRSEKMARKKQRAVTVTAMRNGSDKTVTEEISIHRTLKLGIPTTTSKTLTSFFSVSE